MRKIDIERNTNETKIKLSLNLDGNGITNIKSGSGFFDHMLTLFASHGKFDLNLICDGDTDVDFHHSAEDIGITLGQAFSKALGDKKGIVRYADIILPMDEALILGAVDISGRAHLSYNVNLKATKLFDNSEPVPAMVGSFDSELVEEFLLGFIRNSNITLHFKQLDGSNTHHIIEGVFKAFGRIMRKAVEIDQKFAEEIPSTKGMLQ